MGPLIAKMIFEVVTGNPVSPAFDATAISFVALQQLTTPFILYSFDNSLRNSINEFLWKRKDSRSSSLKESHKSDTDKAIPLLLKKKSIRAEPVSSFAEPSGIATQKIHRPDATSDDIHPNDFPTQHVWRSSDLDPQNKVLTNQKTELTYTYCQLPRWSDSCYHRDAARHSIRDKELSFIDFDDFVWSQIPLSVAISLIKLMPPSKKKLLKGTINMPR